VSFASGCQNFSVPSGVNSINVDAVGAPGTAGGSFRGTGNATRGAAGIGGDVSATVSALTPGSALVVCVDQGGGSGGSPGGGAGGGASGLFTSADGPLVIAGGGGGGGAQDANSGGAGGNAGSPGSADGDTGTGPEKGGGRPRGATQA
jgi:hypothetical protein